MEGGLVSRRYDVLFQGLPRGELKSLLTAMSEPHFKTAARLFKSCGMHDSALDAYRKAALCSSKLGNVKQASLTLEQAAKETVSVELSFPLRTAHDYLAPSCSPSSRVDGMSPLSSSQRQQTTWCRRARSCGRQTFASKQASNSKALTRSARRASMTSRLKFSTELMIRTSMPSRPSKKSFASN